jgi:hypothetical protein
MDLNVRAFRTVQEATSELPLDAKRKRSSARKGGIAGGRNRAQKLTAERRLEIARKANQARWSGQQNESQLQP